MAASDKNILITPARGRTDINPTLVFTGNGADPLTWEMLGEAVGELVIKSSSGPHFSFTTARGPTDPRFATNDDLGVPTVASYGNGDVVISPTYSSKAYIGKIPASAIYDNSVTLEVGGKAYIERLVNPIIVGNLQFEAEDGSTTFQFWNEDTGEFKVNGQYLELYNGNYYNVVTQVDIGTEPNQVPLNGFLGTMAYANYPFAPTTSSTANTTSVVINAPTTALYSHIADLTGDLTVQVANLTSGHEVRMYVRNTNASSRTLTIQASETTSDYADVALAPGGGTVGAASISTITLAATSGTTLVWVGNINGNIVGGVVA
jgi:hypothetical protein